MIKSLHACLWVYHGPIIRNCLLHCGLTHKTIRDPMHDHDNNSMQLRWSYLIIAPMQVWQLSAHLQLPLVDLKLRQLLLVLLATELQLLISCG